MIRRGSARQRRLAGRTARSLGLLCAFGAVGVLAFAAWELWGTGGAEAALQDELRASFDDADERDGVGDGETAGDGEPVASTATGPDQLVDEGDEADADDASALLPGGIAPRIARARFPEAGPALARIEVPAIELDKFVMRDVTVEALQTGPGHYQRTPPPGFDGNAAIAGHRTTYGAPFARVDELQPGDRITVHSADGIFEYEVLTPEAAFGDRLAEIDESDIAAGHVIVQPADTWVVGDFGDARLTLTSCHPKLTSRNRIVVVAELVSEAVPFPAIFGGLGEHELEELVSEDLEGVEGSST